MLGIILLLSLMVVAIFLSLCQTEESSKGRSNEWIHDRSDHVRPPASTPGARNSNSSL